MKKRRCPRCMNEDPKYFYLGSRGWYCRKCVSFGRALLEEEADPISLEQVQADSGEYLLKYPLTSAQQEIGHRACELIQKGDVLIQAVCGAGKTEMVVPLIAMCLKQGKRICFAIARRQVVLELQQRLSVYFPHAKVIAVCGGHTQELEGDLIICTTHQLYRYHQSFDVLILDEPDAFPFKGNVTLHGIAKMSCIGHCVYLTATPDEVLRKRIENGELNCLKLNRRPHGYPLPVPQVIQASLIRRLVLLVCWLKKHRYVPRMVFVPTIQEANRIYRFLSLWMPCVCCTSKTEHRDELIAQYRNNGQGVMIATTVLERGVTIPGVDVCVFDADHEIFDEAGLVQMAGRAGRTFERPKGEVLFLVREKNEMVDRCVASIIEANQCSA